MSPFARCAEAGRIPHPRSARGRAQEIWAPQSPPQLPVLEALSQKFYAMKNGPDANQAPVFVLTGATSPSRFRAAPSRRFAQVVPGQIWLSFARDDGDARKFEFVSWIVTEQHYSARTVRFTHVNSAPGTDFIRRKLPKSVISTCFGEFSNVEYFLRAGALLLALTISASIPALEPHAPKMAQDGGATEIESVVVVGAVRPVRSRPCCRIISTCCRPAPACRSR